MSRIGPFSGRLGRHISRKNGFALLITITLLAFLVLLLVSLASLTRVETQVAGNSQQLAQARQNALMALNIALGQLQKTAGPDQRVTGTADLASGDANGNRVDDAASLDSTVGHTKYWDTTNTPNGLAPVRAGTRYWTGVWGNTYPSAPTLNNGNIYEKTPRPVLLNWLVSGNESATFKVSSATTSFGQITAANGTFGTGSEAPGYSPGVALSSGAITSATKTTDPLTYSATVGAVLLVGPGTAGTSTRTTPVTEPAEDRYVIAPLVNINAPKGTTPGLDNSAAPVIGHYAWWVGDEGVKARLNLVDPNAANTTPATDPKARYRLMTAPRSGAEVTADFSTNSALAAAYPGWSQSKADFPPLKNILDLPQTRFLDSTNIVSDETGPSHVRMAQHIHDFTTVSVGIEADSYNGGLRKDLTYYLEQNKSPASSAWGTGWKSSWNPTGSTDDAGVSQGILPTNYSPIMGALTGDQRIPKWDVVRSFYTLPSKSVNTLTGGSGDKVTVQAASATQVGIAPVVVQMRILIGGAGNKTAVTAGPAPSLGATSFRLLMNTLVVLANPYTSKLSAPSGIDFTLRNDLRLKNPDNIFKFEGGTNGSHTKWPFNDLATGSANTAKLHIPTFVLDPGESAAFFVQGAQRITAGGTINLTRLAAGSPPNPTGVLTDYFYQDYTSPSWTTDGTFHFTEVGGNATFLVEFTLPGTTQILQQLGGLNIDRSTNDYPSSENTSTAAPGTPLVGCVYQLKYNTPGEVYSSTGGNISGGQANSSLRGLADFNPRAGYYRQTNYTNFSAPYCESFMSGGNTSAKLTAFSTDLVTLYWGRSTAAATATVQKTALFDIPRWNAAGANPELEQPIISLGGLQHVNLTAEDMPSTTGASPWSSQGVNGFNAFTAEFGSPSGGYAASTVNALSTPLPPNPGHQPAYAFANSYAPIFLARDKTVQSRTDTWQSRIKDNPETPVTASRNYFDISYLLNAALWDGYFFSTIPQSGGKFAPQSPRFSQRTDIANLQASDVRIGEKAAAYTLINGAFNINSTSVDAWVALLAGMKNLPRLPNLSTGADPNTATVFPRTLRQTAAAATSPTLTGDDSYTGYRQLTDVEVRSLAIEIVKQVRMRGPFVSLSQFVNRVLATAARDGTLGLGQAGAIQKAIDNAGINTGPAGFTTADKAVVPTVTDGGVVSEAGSRGANSLYADTSSAATPTALQRSTAIPGWLTQADVLQAIGPVLSARSDTFVIRTYGEVNNPVTTDISARAWCEAVVQRMPDYLESATNSAEVAPVLASTTNQTFGRTFKVISFRWLGPNDI